MLGQSENSFAEELAATPRHAPQQPVSSVPKYRSIKHLAQVFRITGLMQILTGVVGLSAAALPPLMAWANDRSERLIASTEKRQFQTRASQVQAIAEQEKLLTLAHPDAHEMLKDRINECKKALLEGDEDRAAEIRALRDQSQRAKAARFTLWSTLFGTFGWAHVVFVSGLVSLGIGQMIQAFRDLVINSFRQNE